MLHVQPKHLDEATYRLFAAFQIPKATPHKKGKKSNCLVFDVALQIDGSAIVLFLERRYCANAHLKVGGHSGKEKV